VLALGSYQSAQARTAAAGPTPRTGSLMRTVAVEPADAERLIEGLSHGTLYLGLLTDSVEVKADAGVDNTDGRVGSVPLLK
jgi:hypothetical protein